MIVTSQTDIGLKRSSNQDACSGGIFKNDIAWVLVCDGMGGANGGDIASQIALSEISERLSYFYEKEFFELPIKEMMLETFLQVNAKIHETAKSNVDLFGMGTTAILAIIMEQKLHIVHVGDSRAYLVSQDRLRQLTVDHSIVQEMLDKGDLTAKQAAVHPHKNIITRVLGVQPFVDIDYIEIDFNKEDTLLLCSDGLSNYVDDNIIFQTVKKFHQKNLTQMLIDLAKKGGGGDNITVAIIENYENKSFDGS